MKGAATARRAIDSVEPTQAEQMDAGSLAHKVLNSTAAIRYAASALRAGGALSAPDLADLARMEEAAAAIAGTVKTFASSAANMPAAPVEEQPVDLYEVVCELAERLRMTEGCPIYCRAFGDCRGPWDRQTLMLYLSTLMDVAVRCLKANGMLNVAATGLGHHARLDLHGLGWMTPKRQQECLELAAAIRGPRGSMVTVRVRRGAGTTISLRLPR